MRQDRAGRATPLKWLRSPGLRELTTVAGHAGDRGFIEINGSVIAALEDRAVLPARSGALYAVTDHRALSGARCAR
jgi:hypothetical protein